MNYKYLSLELNEQQKSSAVCLNISAFDWLVYERTTFMYPYRSLLALSWRHQRITLSKDNFKKYDTIIRYSQKTKHVVMVGLTTRKILHD